VVTLGLSAGGTIVGAAAGALALGIAMVPSGAPASAADLIILSVPAIVGALLGAVLTPIAAWMLLRRVPLGRAFLVLAAGTIAGGVFGWLLLDRIFPRHWDPIEASVAAAVFGFVVAAVALRVTVGRRREPPGEPRMV